MMVSCHDVLPDRDLIAAARPLLGPRGCGNMKPRRACAQTVTRRCESENPAALRAAWVERVTSRPLTWVEIHPSCGVSRRLLARRRRIEAAVEPVLLHLFVERLARDPERSRRPAAGGRHARRWPPAMTLRSKAATRSASRVAGAAPPRPPSSPGPAQSGRPRCAVRARCPASRAPASRRSSSGRRCDPRRRGGRRPRASSCRNSSGMSSRRAASGGTRSVATFSR